MGKKRMTQPSISVPQDNVTKAKTIIEGVTVSVLFWLSTHARSQLSNHEWMVANF